MEWSDHSDRLLDAFYDNGHIAPDHLFQPEFLPDAAPIFSAWVELSTSRPVSGFGVSPIPFDAIDRYAERYGPHDLDGFDLFRRFVRALDDCYLAWNRRKEGDDADNN